MPGWPSSSSASRRRRTAAVSSLQIVNPWTQPSQMRAPRSRAQRTLEPFVAVVVLIVLAVAALVARHNLRKGRGDPARSVRDFRHSSSSRCSATGWWARPTSRCDVELDRVFTALGCRAVLRRRAVGALPRPRTVCPEVLADDANLVEPLVAGMFDPQVGRDVLIGVFGAVSVVLVSRVDYHVRPLLGYRRLPMVRTWTCSGYARRSA